MTGTLRDWTRRGVVAPVLLARSRRSFRSASARGLPAAAFAEFGRSAGRRILLRRPRLALDLLLTPVNIVRYFEFDFALRHLRERPGRCLDASSPRLFSLYLAARGKPESILMANPDPGDVELSADLARLLDLPVTTATTDIRSVHASGARFDSIWSISVVEHVHGAYDDVAAMDMLWDMLEPRARLVVTVPVDREHHDEYRRQAYYGTADGGGGEVFFQRIYDREALDERLIGSRRDHLVGLEWYGEREPGRFAAYERQWMSRGHRVTVDDPIEIVEHWRPYASWAEMPGAGVCALALERPGA